MQTKQQYINPIKSETMKTQIFKNRIMTILLASLFVLPGLVSAKGDYSKPTKKEFEVNKNALLELDCEFTDVKAYNWDKDVISIEVTVTVDAKSESDADDKFEKVLIEMSGTKSAVSLRTGLNKGYFGKNKNNSIDIEVIIYYPSHINLDLDNEFGSSFFEDIDGKVNVDISYGNFEARNLINSELDLEAEFGQIKVKRFQSGKVEVAYGGFIADIAGALKLNSAFSSNEVESVDHMELETAYDKNYFGSVSTAFVNSEFSSVRIDYLEKHLELSVAYGSFKLKSISETFEKIQINSEFTSVDLYFKTPLNFAFKLSAEMGDIDYPKDLAKITFLEKEMMELNLEGYFGNAKGQSPKLILEVENASANINIK